MHNRMFILNALVMYVGSIYKINVISFWTNLLTECKLRVYLGDIKSNKICALVQISNKELMGKTYSRLDYRCDYHEAFNSITIMYPENMTSLLVNIYFILYIID